VRNWVDEGPNRDGWQLISESEAWYDEDEDCA
jgi:hypothetical protein